MGLFVQPASASWNGMRIELIRLQSLNSERLFHTFVSWKEDSALIKLTLFIYFSKNKKKSLLSFEQKRFSLLLNKNLDFY